jgi:hypothetical protein
MAVALAVIAMALIVPPAAAPQIRNPLLQPKKFFLPDPMIGIRGDAAVLKIPIRS